jgi:hypothetical protein
VRLSITDEVYAALTELEAIPHKCLLKDNATFGLGIVTGNNRSLITTTRAPDAEPILRGTGIHKFRIAPSGEYIRFAPKQFQQTAPEPIYRAPEKLVYRFISGGLIFAYDDAQALTLNSANILIPHIPGLHAKYILAVLNSTAASFYWRTKFGSVKVLRSHLEQIPIPAVPPCEQAPIIALTDELINGSGSFEALDARVTKAYNLSPEAQEIICSDWKRMI